uniref:Mre11 DNA-binding domain-containing protein n=1 Tax=Odontella aurita TaxID=265563 RepID=A0A7S4MXX5_9STRA|mmetsp:Transcript_3925/g.10828  ORF Transcript_3925/g.10828 Transcript_3925/m.10828 type:complete len:894 (+) Transcript_3925:301-2982(+)
MSDDERHEDEGSGGASPPPDDHEGGEEEEVDEDTLRIMVSTDNHLGYAERDPIRGLDSFAAFEEVLALAKRHKCDMLLLAGDLFHDNKPSRRTLHKTMEIIRRYCMGPQPVQFQIVSDQAENFRGPTNTVNYEDEHYSIDLPIFSIHGNHDDPTRDGGTEMLAALDLLAVTNLVNYFGRQDEVDKVEVAPVLIKKGSTKVAIYGMGSMRDERLNRMWQGKKVRFLEPVVAAGEEEDDEDDDEEGGVNGGWFNIFALHQNRDLGRGSKNCVHESMIPEYMDLVVWGHEHECKIEPDESAVGTFRISQPGSSVATSLTAGEAEKKQVGILDIRGQSFRLRPVPLSQVRPFATGEVSLRDEADDALDPEDPNVDEAMADVLADHVQSLIDDAREQAEKLREEAEEAAREALPLGTADLGESGDASILGNGQKYKLMKPDQVLVRLKVEHSGFGTLNNQRFGSRFVTDIANPSDILLFHRRKQVESVKKGGSKAGSKRGELDKPMEPEELAEVNVEDLVKENLELADKKLQVLDERRLGIALDEFVSKEQRQAIADTVEDELKRSQKELIRRKRDGDGNGEGGESKITTAAAVREICEAKADKRAVVDESRRAAAASKKGDAAPSQEDHSDDGDEDVVMNGDDDSDNGKRVSSKAGAAKKARRGARSKKDDDSEDDLSDTATGRKGPAKRARTAASAKSKSSSASRAASGRSAARSRKTTRYEESSEDDDIEVVETPAPSAGRKKSSRNTAASSRPSRRAAAASSARGRYKDVHSDDESGGGDDDFVDSPADEEDDDFGDVEIVEEKVAPKKRGVRSRATPASSAKKQSTLSTKSFTSARKPKAKSSGSTGRRKRATTSYYDDDDSDEGGGGMSGGLGAGWGTASSQASHSSRRSRR